MSSIVGAVIISLPSSGLGVPAVAWPGIIASGCVSLGLSLALFYIAMKYIGAARTGIISSSATLFGVGGSVFVLGEQLNMPIIIGGITMLAGLAGLTFSGERAKGE